MTAPSPATTAAPTATPAALAAVAPAPGLTPVAAPPVSGAPPFSPQDALYQWWLRCAGAVANHYAAARRFGRLHTLVGVPAVVLSTVAGSTVLASLQRELGPEAKLAVGLISITAAALAAIQTALKYNDRSERHRVAGVQFSRLVFRIERLMTMSDQRLLAHPNLLEDVERSTEAVASKSPTLPRSIIGSREAEVLLHEMPSPKRP